MTTTHESLRILDQLRTQLAAITDQQTRDLVAAYAAGWDEVAPEFAASIDALLAAARDGTVTRAAVARSQRLASALRVISDSLETLSERSGVRIVGDLRRIIAEGGMSEVSMVIAQLPPDGAGLAVSWSQVDAGAIDAIVARATQQIESAHLPLARDAVRVMRRELIRGVAVGDNPNETARRIVARTQGRFEGGAVRAVRIARTETMDAVRGGARLADLKNADVLQGWTWTASLSSRTCPACWSMSGSVHDIDEGGPDGHANCRCTRGPLTKSWRDLGFDIDEPTSLLPDPGATFDRLPPEQQQAVLGGKGYDAYKAGVWPMSDWAEKRSTPQWRDSYVAARPPSVPSVSSDRLAS